MKYMIRIINIDTEKIEKKVCHFDNPSEMVKALGECGYHIISYAEWSPNNVFLVPMKG